MANQTGEKSDVKNLKFEEALAKLEQIVSQIEEGKVSLEESIERYGQGIAMIGQCRSILDQAEKKIQILGRGEGQTLQVEGELQDTQES